MSNLIYFCVAVKIMIVVNNTIDDLGYKLKLYEQFASFNLNLWPHWKSSKKTKSTRPKTYPFSAFFSAL